MVVLVSGAGGLIGSRLTAELSARGHRVLRLVRAGPGESGDTIRWDPYAGEIEAGRLEGIDAAVHLSGENVAGRWTQAKKSRIRDSRVDTTRYLAQVLSRMESPPGVLICASAVGYYGERGEELLTEQSGPGDNFMAGVCMAWEGATKPAAEKGIRVVNLRIGIVLSRGGGALGTMLLPFRLGVGGVIGSGRQYWSWIALGDLIGVVDLALAEKALAGPVNAVSPSPVTNREFTRTLGRVLSRPAVIPLPAFAARLFLGDVADELLMASARVDPEKLRRTGYVFHFPELEPALRTLLTSEGVRARRG
jgi:uncharacterized protein (TIGR01777 family)